MLKTLDPVVSGDYNLVYYHSLFGGALVTAPPAAQHPALLPSRAGPVTACVSVKCAGPPGSNKPPYQWIKQVYSIFNRKYNPPPPTAPC